ncbi:MAG TPA: hypothetical protein VF733_04235 [Candidatus Saccharimonadales bacterium]
MSLTEVAHYTSPIEVSSLHDLLTDYKLDLLPVQDVAMTYGPDIPDHVRSWRKEYEMEMLRTQKLAEYAAPLATKGQVEKKEPVRHPLHDAVYERDELESAPGAPVLAYYDHGYAEYVADLNARAKRWPWAFGGRIKDTSR